MRLSIVEIRSGTKVHGLSAFPSRLTLGTAGVTVLETCNIDGIGCVAIEANGQRSLIPAQAVSSMRVADDVEIEELPIADEEEEDKGDAETEDARTPAEIFAEAQALATKGDLEEWAEARDIAVNEHSMTRPQMEAIIAEALGLLSAKAD